MRNYQPPEIAELSLAGNLPSLPTVALEILRLCHFPESSIGDLVEPISLDPMLASRVLQLANSAHYTRGHPTTSLHRAGVLLGLRTVKVLALGFMLVNELPRSPAKSRTRIHHGPDTETVNSRALQSISRTACHSSE